MNVVSSLSACASMVAAIGYRRSVTSWYVSSLVPPCAIVMAVRAFSPSFPGGPPSLGAEHPDGPAGGRESPGRGVGTVPGRDRMVDRVRGVARLGVGGQGDVVGKAARPRAGRVQAHRVGVLEVRLHLAEPV